MNEIQKDFRERCQEIESYLQMLRFVEAVGVTLVSRDGRQRRRIDTTTQHVLKASVYLHLYNLVEATITQCVHRIAEEIRDSRLSYHHLGDEWRRAWLRVKGKGEDRMSADRRLDQMLTICDRIVDETVIDFKPPISLNVDDKRIEEIVKRYGIRLELPPHVRNTVKRHVHDRLGTLELIRQRRNDLAHGFTSFAECGRELTVRDLRIRRVVVVRYLRVVIKSFTSYLDGRGFERPRDAPADGVA